MALTPGLSYLLVNLLPRAVIPTGGVCVALAYAIRKGLPKLGTPAICILTALVMLTGLKLFSRLQQLRLSLAARRHNAALVPIVRGRWPGNLDVLLKMLRAAKENYKNQLDAELCEEYGDTFNVRLLGTDLIYTTNPYHSKQLLVTDFTSWEKGDALRLPLQPLLGNGVFNSDGDMWKFHRNMTRPFFARERISDFEIFGEHAKAVVGKIRQCHGEPLDFQDVAGKFTMDSATDFLFGQSVNSISAPLAKPHGDAASGRDDHHSTEGDEISFADSFKTALEVALIRLLIGPHWPLWEIKSDRMQESVNKIRDYIDPIVQRALTKRRSSLNFAHEETKEEQKTLLDELISMTDDAAVIRDELLNILLAGRDTTAHLITATMYLLVTEDPSIMARLRKEINTVVGFKTPPTFDQLKEMKYLRAIINETLRLFPSVPANLKESVKPSVWSDPTTGTRYYIPEGTRVSWISLLMHRRTDLWGPDALSFDPDRWLDDRHKQYYLANPFIYIPFNAGPRICLGQQFALNETAFIITRLLQSFDDISFAPDAFPPGTLPPPEWKSSKLGRKAIEKVWPKAHLTMYFNGGLWLRMKTTVAHDVD